MLTLLVLLLLGTIAGLLAGIFGIGGGILFTPVLFVLFSNAGVSNPALWTIATSLFCTMIAAFGSSVRQFYQQNFYLNEGLKVGFLGIIGISAGKMVITSAYYSEREFVVIFSLLLVYVSIMFFRRGRSSKRIVENNSYSISLPRAGFIGGLGGFFAALAGIGGGGVMVPLMNLYYKQLLKKAVSVSSFAIVLISLAGWIQLSLVAAEGGGLTLYTAGYVDFGAAVPLAAGGLIGGFLGALMTVKIKREYLQYGFAALAAVMAVKLITEVF